MTNIYLNLDIENFESTKEKAKQRDIEDSGEDASGYKYPNLELSGESTEYQKDSGQFEIYGDLIDTDTSKNLGYVSITIAPDMDLIIDLIEFYMKKLGKLKTILEATK